MAHSQNWDEHIKKMQKFFDNNFTKEIFEDDYKDFIALNTNNRKYSVSKNAGGYLGRYGHEGRIFLDMLVNKLDALDREHNEVNWCGVMTLHDFLHNNTE
jgi:hypothetical protein